MLSYFTPIRILSTQKDALAIIDGQLVICTDTGAIFLDQGTERIPAGSTTAEIQAAIAEAIAALGLTDLLAGKQDKINATGAANLLTAPSTAGGQPGTKALSELVQTTGNQTIAGTKTFSTAPVIPSKSAAGSSATTPATEKMVYDVTQKIPSQATSDNQLADKAFVNSSIQSNSANPVTYNAAGDAFPTWAAFNSATTVYSHGAAYTPSKNDYFVVLADETKAGAQTRYVYQDATHTAFQYEINPTPFTAAQNASINSGITSALVGYITSMWGYFTGTAAKLAVKLQTARNITISGDATGSASFDGSSDASIALTVVSAAAAVAGKVKLFSDTVQTVAAAAVSNTASRTYGIQQNSAGQAVVNVPWSNTTYSALTQALIDAGTETTGKLVSAKMMKDTAVSAANAAVSEARLMW